MFDTYEPQPPIDCPLCGGPSLGWKGNDGPCALFLWRQSHRHPVDQPIDEDARIERDRYSDFTLRPRFGMVGWCANEHLYMATGQAPKGTWTTTMLIEPRSCNRRYSAEQLLVRGVCVRFLHGRAQVLGGLPHRASSGPEAARRPPQCTIPNLD
jgi:hypothetical protein